MINCCLKDLMRVLLSIDDDDDDDDNDVHQEVVNRSNDGIVEEESKEEEEGPSLVLKSSLRKFDSNSRESEKMKRVQWVDVMGIKELADIREYEPSEEDDDDSDRGKACDCVIL
ncbi:hypothetical protein AALP_AA4G009400 [Arabis alpina]|uniref:Uncharacterized protein n=1 Tax=Arabis alpina TaxID=50452 RepID=A0A087H0C8_ARAAL|nr:hypothetical protein AALP_AA4G009400 [Arabis alpina]